MIFLIKKYIKSHYHENPDSFRLEVQELSSLREVSATY